MNVSVTLQANVSVHERKRHLRCDGAKSKRFPPSRMNPRGEKRKKRSQQRRTCGRSSCVRRKRTGRRFHIKRRVQNSTKGFSFEEEKKKTHLNCFAPDWPWQELSDKSQERSGKKHAANVAFCANETLRAPPAARLNAAEGEESSARLRTLLTFPHTSCELCVDASAR